VREKAGASVFPRTSGDGGMDFPLEADKDFRNFVVFLEVEHDFSTYTCAGVV